MSFPGIRFNPDIKSILRKGCALVLGIVMSLVLLEGILGSVRAFCSYMMPGGKANEERLLPYEPWGLTQANKYDPICYFLPRKFFRGPIGGIDCPKEKKVHQIRIMCIGDSTTYGIAVNYYHSWPYLLGTMLSGKYPGKKIEVLNAGLSGSIPKQVKRIFQFHLVQYQPDILIWRSSSDLNDKYLVDTTPHPVRSFIFRHLYESRAFRFLCALADLWDMGENGRRKAAGKIYDFMTDRVTRHLEPPVDGFFSDFGVVKKIAQEHGTKYALQVEYLIRGRKGMISTLTRTEGKEPVVKMMDAFMEQDAKDSLLKTEGQSNRRTKLSDTLFVDDCHLTEKGETITAEEIYKYIVQSKWIESFP